MILVIYKFCNLGRRCAVLRQPLWPLFLPLLIPQTWQLCVICGFIEPQMKVETHSLALAT